jgi:flavin reductase (DIM6/NTAB) family NADH-FMN oxidoreductase RutF
VCARTSDTDDDALTIPTTHATLYTQFIGEIIDVKADETILENELPIMEKIKPILYAPGVGNYYGVGSYLGKAHSIGKKM